MQHLATLLPDQPNDECTTWLQQVHDPDYPSSPHGLRMVMSGCACAGSDVPLVVKLFCAAQPKKGQWRPRDWRYAAHRMTRAWRADNMGGGRALTKSGLLRWSVRLSMGPCAGTIRERERAAQQACKL